MPSFNRRSRPTVSIEELISVSQTSRFLADPFRPTARQIARTARNVQHFIAFFQVRRVDGEMLPHPVQPCRHDIIHNVVVFGDGVEHFRHFADFLIFVDRAEPEMRFCPPIF